MYAVLLLAGAVNLTAAVVLVSTQPDRAHDLDTMYRWCRQWALDGTSLYTGADALTDYPPNAIPVLAVIALLPWRPLVAIWTVATAALTPLLAYVTVRATTRLRGSAVVLPVLLFLSWAAPRTLLQFSVVSMTAAFAAVWIAQTRPTLSGLSLGLALAKPHIAAPCFLWTLCTRRWRVAITAALVVLASFAAYAARIPENPLLVARGYAQVIATTYAGPEGLVGLTSIRAWTRSAGKYSDIVWIAASVLLLALACWTAARTRAGCTDDRMIALGTLNVWSLLTFYHNGHNLILMFPAFLYLLCGDGTFTSARIVAIAALQLAMMFDVPTRLGPLAPPHGWQHVVIRDFDRAIALVMFCGLVVAGRRCDPE